MTVNELLIIFKAGRTTKVNICSLYVWPMDVVLYAAGIMAFAPTMLLMYIVLRKYTYPKVEQPFFSDPAFFGLFVVGLISGTLLFAFYTYLNWQNMFHMVLFAAVQCLFMVVVLNLKRFHGKSDTVFYGYGLGLGMGCAMAFGTLYYLVMLGKIIADPGGGEMDAMGYVSLFMIAVSHILIISSIGATIGEGVARLRPMEFALQGIFVNVVFSLVLVAAYNNTQNEILFYLCLTVALIVAAVYFYYIMYAKLSRVVRDVLKMEGKKRNDVPK